ncbi:anti-apoptotic protein NR13-like [Arapaima gigas]
MCRVKVGAGVSVARGTRVSPFLSKMSSALERDTLQVARDYVEFCLGIQRDPPSESARAMRHLAKQTERQQQATLHSLVQNFLDNHALDLLSSLQQVMAALVHDGQLNWGRVVALFAFIGMLAHRLSLQGDNIRRLAETIARYLSEEHREWLLQNGGWAGFLAFFHTARNMDSELSNLFFVSTDRWSAMHSK